MAKTSAQPYKGTRDFLPIDVRRRAFVTAKIRAVYESHGFAPLETPALERLDTLMGKYGEEGDQLLFKVLLRGQPLVEGIREAAAHVGDAANLVEGRSGVTAPRAEPMLADVGLRYDLTVPLARVYAAHQGKLPPVFKRYQIQPVWRADTPGKGRFREFFQCDVDVCGSSSLLVEADVLAAAAEALQALGFESFELRLNHRALLRALVEQSGIDVAQEGEAITAVDKLDKIGADGVIAELARRGVAEESTKRLLALLSDENGVVGRVSLDRIAEAMSSHDKEQAIGELREVMRLSQLTAAGKHLRFDLSLARGLGYYTGCIFEIAVPDLGSSMGGGGRYDGLIGMFLGREVPACGLSLGLERILVVMEERKMYPESLGGPDVLLAGVGSADLDRALELAQQLRSRGVKVDLLPGALGGGKVGKLRAQADTEGLRAAVWIEQGNASAWLRASNETLRDQTAESLADAILGKSSLTLGLVEELKWRGLLHQTTAGEAATIKHLSTGVRTGYCGFDPTKDSLTIGGFIAIKLLMHLQRAGHKPIVLMGGGTGMIGDPSGKDAERTLMTRDEIEANVAGQRSILEKLIDFSPSISNAAVIVNNADWLGKLGFIEVLRDVGKHFSVNAMIQRDSVKQRLEAREQGISYTEFSCMLLQAYDFLHLRRTANCSLQLAGSDQYGNIVSGVDLIHHTLGREGEHTEAFGITSPLVTRSDGKKMGKTRRGAVFLSADRTSPYALYQYFVNVDDADVVRFLKWFTFLDEARVGELAAEHEAAPQKRVAHKALAAAMAEVVHGATERERAERASEALFSGDVRGLDERTLGEVFADVPSTEHPKIELSGEGLSLVDFIATTSLASSKREARQFLQTGAIAVNGEKVGPEHRLRESDLLHGTRILLRRGKKQWHATVWQ